MPERLILVVNLDVLVLIGGCYLVSAKEKSIRVAIDELRGNPDRLGSRHQVFGDFVPGDIKVHMIELGILENRFNSACMTLDRTDDSAHSRMCPNERGFGMPRQHGFHLS